MCGVLFLTQGQAIDIGGITVYATRLLMLVGFLRTVWRRELAHVRWNDLDTMFVVAYGYTASVYLANGNGPPLMEVGKFVDYLLAYFSFRALIEDAETFQWFLKQFAVALGFYAILVSVEMFTERNPFSIMGGVAEKWDFRGGRLRCMGSFRHPSLLGTLGASFFPLYVWLTFSPSTRFRAYLGMAACVAIVYMSNSGGPLTALAVAVIAWLFWPFRKSMRTVRYMMLVSFLLVIVLMKAPLWYLPAKVSAVLGGDGWHRSYLMEVAFSHIGEWWLAGTHVLNTSDWFPYVVVTGGADLINYYLDFAIAGGLAALLLFLYLLVKAFGRLGVALTVARSCEPKDLLSERLLWALGAVLTVHVFNWFGIVYFDQTYVLWLFQLASISVFARAEIFSSVRNLRPTVTQSP